MEKTEYQFNTKTMEELKDDETVLWTGRPEPFKLVNETNKKSLTLRWIICGALFVLLTVLYTVFTVGSPAGFKPAVVIVLVIIFGYLMLAPVLDHNKAQKKCQYIVTDKRVLSAIGDNAVYAVGRAGLKLKAVPAEAGCVHLLFGAAADKLSASKYMVKALVPIKAEGGGDEIVGLVFYNVKDIRELRDIFGY